MDLRNSYPERASYKCGSLSEDVIRGVAEKLYNNAEVSGIDLQIWRGERNQESYLFIGIRSEAQAARFFNLCQGFPGTSYVCIRKFDDNEPFIQQTWAEEARRYLDARKADYYVILGDKEGNSLQFYFKDQKECENFAVAVRERFVEAWIQQANSKLLKLGLP